MTLDHRTERVATLDSSTPEQGDIRSRRRGGCPGPNPPGSTRLGHDIGHPPFGHAGEDELRSCMKAFGGFDHNVQTFRVVTELERRYPDFNGLNLTWETLEGIIKHNGPVTEKLEQAVLEGDRPSTTPGTSWA